MNRQEPSRDPIADKAREMFERRSDHVDANTAARLRQARRDAMTPRTSRPVWLPLGAATAAVLLVGIAWWAPRTQDTVAPGTTTDSALTVDIEGDVLSSDAESDLYSWLGDAPVAPDEGAL